MGYIRRSRREQIMMSVAITDPKDDRRLRPSSPAESDAGYASLDMVLGDRRWDLFEHLLLEAERILRASAYASASTCSRR
jgi:hypothetical protein